MMGSAPGRPAPSLPGVVPPPSTSSLPSGLLAPDSEPLTLSSSLTEPGPVEFDDNFFNSPAPTQPEPAASDSVDGISDFFIGDNDSSPPSVTESKPEEVKTDEVKTEEVKTAEELNKEAEQPERKTSFWSGLWSRNKDHGSKENILENEVEGKFYISSLQLYIFQNSPSLVTNMRNE